MADYVISDYSCIIYEAAVLKIPLYFWAFDLQEYIDKRGLTLDYKKELPGVVSEKIEDILQAIQKEQYDDAALKKFQEKYIVKTENCTKDIVEFIVEMMRKKNEK